ncbi:hypothetical protein [Brucella anthropi]|uniref:Uncharacterized protein n=1 Tax=Brucella anthropi TaxID=529 RepID=A0A6L3Z9E4_BRUAN|nr:hypothetical protein [Brucella anthropi]KAB2772441.1 hypothetical protein F9L04_06885 [Brucella anthropi]UVV69931.1 hypothetical protein NW321_15260 [Brucella anthropi]
MSRRIEIPSANLRNIDQFDEEPGDDIVADIKRHIKETSNPCSWWGHSHTPPPVDAVVVYLDEFDVPAPKSVKAIAACPCCSPNHAKYKSRGKIAWFPNEKVIRLLGPICFKAINAQRHEEAWIDLQRRKKVRQEIEIIRDFWQHIPTMIKAIEHVLPIASDLDRFMFDLNRVFDEAPSERMPRHVMDGVLKVSVIFNAPFIKPDGSISTRQQERFEQFGRLDGYSMLDRSGKPTAEKLTKMLIGLDSIAKKLEATSNVADLDEHERHRISIKLPECKETLLSIVKELASRQRFLVSNDIQLLDRWGRHHGAPVSLGITRERSDVSVTLKPRRGAEIHKVVVIGRNATGNLPDLVLAT